MESLILKRLTSLNPDLPKKFENAFSKKTNLADKYIGERKINNHIESRNSLFPSKKAQCLICLESNLERAHALLLERNEEIDNYKTQSIKIYLNEKNYVVPDFLVKTNSRFEIHEIKANLSIISERQKIRFNLIQILLDHYSIKFRKFDQKNLPDLYQTNILNHCYQRIRSGKINKYELIRAEAILSKNRVYSIKDIYEVLFKNDIPTYIGDYLIFYKRILGF
jgi:hypothetical protein